MKKKNFESYLYSVVGVIAMFVILAAIYVMFSASGIHACRSS